VAAPSMTIVFAWAIRARSSIQTGTPDAASGSIPLARPHELTNEGLKTLREGLSRKRGRRKRPFGRRFSSYLNRPRRRPRIDPARGFKLDASYSCAGCFDAI
jgi:hypothetical protein